MNITECQILIPTLTTVNTAGSTVILLNLHAEKNTGKKNIYRYFSAIT